jgi:hypothetical protein
VPNSFHSIRIDLQEVATRNDAARHIIAGFSDALPTLAGYWQTIITALADTAALSAALTRARLDHANLLASARATLSAHDEGEADPLSYLRDELGEQTERESR